MSGTTQSRMTQYMNQWLLNLQKGIKTIKYWNYRQDKYCIQLKEVEGDCYVAKS